jgi:N-carbamoylputrescine amidase
MRKEFSEMKIALACAPAIDRNIEANISSMISTIKSCANHNDLIVFGETALQGFDCLEWNYVSDRHMAAAKTDDSVLQICRAAAFYRTAVSFGCIEKDGEALYSSQLFIDDRGIIINDFHRVSRGWKDYKKTDQHYQEGISFSPFIYKNRSIAVGLCGDLWEENRPQEMKELSVNIVLWPVWCDYKKDEWNQSIKYEYAKQAGLCGDHVLLVNPYCIADESEERACGGAVYFNQGIIQKELPAGRKGILSMEI